MYDELAHLLPAEIGSVSFWSYTIRCSLVQKTKKFLIISDISELWHEQVSDTYCI